MTSDERWLIRAIELSAHCPPSAGAFSVGCVIVDASGLKELSTGFSRESAPHVHAEEVALGRLGSKGAKGSSLYSSLEPCSTRLSGRRSCTDRIVEAGVARVVFALNEPATFVTCEGEARLRAHGIEVVVLPDLARRVAEINRHLNLD